MSQTGHEEKSAPGETGDSGQPSPFALAAEVQAIRQPEVSSGPPPNPRSFQAHGTALPGAAERILRMAGTEQQQRHEEQSVLTRSDVALESRGQ